MKKTMTRKSDTKITDDELMKNIHNMVNVEDFLSYKELAELIGIKRTNGRSKKLQIENLRRFMEFEYDSAQKKYLITNIYDEYLPKKSRKLREDAIYTKYIEMLLLEYLRKQDGYSAVMSKTSWWVTLSMVNSDFVKYKNIDKRKLLLSEHLTSTMDSDNIDAFFDATIKRFTTLFSRSLKSLESRMIINTPSYVYIYRFDDDKPGEFKIANDNLVSKIIDCEYDALHEIGFKTKEQLFIHPEKKKEYYRILNDIEYRRLGFVECYRELQIVFGKNHLDEEFNYTKQQILDAAIECNDAFKTNIDNYIINNYNKNRVVMDNAEDMSIDEMNDFLNTIGIDTNLLFINNKVLKDYVNNQLTLSNRLIKIVRKGETK